MDDFRPTLFQEIVWSRVVTEYRAVPWKDEEKRVVTGGAATLALTLTLALNRTLWMTRAWMLLLLKCDHRACCALERRAPAADVFH